MRQEFTYNQIAHLNAALHEQRLPYRFYGSRPVETGETGKVSRLEGRSRNSKIFEMGTDF